MCVRWGPVALSLFFAACNFKLARTNPLDPDAPPEQQRLAQLTGKLVLEDNGTSASAEVAIIGNREGEAQPRRVETKPLDDGTFLIEAPAGNYVLNAKLAGYATQPLSGITLVPGGRYDIGELYLSIVRGSVRGSVKRQTPARETATAGGAAVTLYKDGGHGSAANTVCDQSGEYRIDGLPAGTYSLRATLEDYVPGGAGSTFTVTAGGVASAPEVTLYPASAIVKVRGGPFTRTREVEVELFAFVENLTHMRVSLDESFPGSDFVDFNATLPFTLADDDGTQTLYAQFRDSEGRETDTFTTTVTLDRTAPVASSFVVGDGGAFVTADVVPVLATGLDALSGIDRYRLSIDGALDTEPILFTDSVSNVTALDLAQSLGSSDGSKDLVFVFIDRAGNVSEEMLRPLYKDTVAPQTAAPAITLGAGATTATADVALTFNVTGDRADEPLYVALATSMGQSDSAARVPLADVATFLLTGGDGMKTVCAKFFDAAGNSSEESCDFILLDTTGELHGVVTLENQSVHSGVTVTLGHSDSGIDLSAIPPAVTNALGEFSLPNIPAGAGYKLTFTYDDYVTIVDQDLVVVPGIAQNRGVYPMSIVRSGLISGTVTIDGSGSFAGTTVAAVSTSGTPTTYATATTGIDGKWTMTGLPVGPYSFTASRSGYTDQTYSPATITIVNSDPVLLGNIELGTQTGDFRICNGSEAPVSSCAIRVDFTNESTLKLGFTIDATPREFFVNETGATPDLNGNSGWDTLSATEAYTLASTTDGEHTIYVWYRDIPRTTLTGPFQASVTFDDDPPNVASVLINGGDTYTQSTSVTLELSATDATTSVVRMIRSNDDRTFNETPDTYQTTYVGHTLPSSAGAHTVYVQFCDQANNCTVAATSPGDAITLDQTPPTGTSFSINNDATYTTSPFVSLTLSSTDAAAVRYGTSSNLDAVDWTSIATGAVSLPAVLQGIDGDVTLYVQFKDAAGNATTPALSDTIRLDRAPPTVSSFTLTPSTTTSSTSITVNMTVTGETPVVQYTLSQNPTFTGAAAFANVTATAPFTLSTGDGDKTVYGRFKDAAGNTVDVSATVVLDTTPPSSGAIAVSHATAPSGYATTTAVTAALSAVGATQMCLYGDFAGSPGDSCNAASSGWTTYATTQALTLSAGAGSKQVNVKYRDGGGITVGPYAASIIYDATIPSSTSCTMTGQARSGVDASTITNAPDVTVALTGFSDATSGLLEMRVWESPGSEPSTWDVYTSGFVWLLSSADGSKTLNVKARDAAGLESTTRSCTITLDRTAPSAATVAIEDDDTYALSTTVALTITASDAVSSSANLQVQVSQDAAFAGASWVAYAPTSADLTGGDGTKTLYVRVRDEAGNISGTSLDSIFLDRGLPESTRIIAAAPRTTTVFLDLDDSVDVSPGSGVSSYEIEVRNEDGTALSTNADTTFSISEGWLSVPSAMQVYRFRARAVDAAGNPSAWSAPFMSQVGLTANILEGMPNLGDIGDRVYSYRGFVLFPRAVSSMSGGRTELVYCDARRDRCQDAGFKNGAVSLATTPVDVSIAMAGERLSVFTAASDNMYIDSLINGKPDDIAFYGTSSAWTRTTLPYDIGITPPLQRTLAATSNGKVTALAWADSATTMRMRVCANGRSCTSPTDWSSTFSLPTGTRWSLEPGASGISLEAGEDHLWLSYPTRDTRPSGSGGPSDTNLDGRIDCNDTGACGFAVFGCAISSNAGGHTGCASASDWYGPIKVMKGTGFVSSVRVLEANRYLYLLGVEAPQAPDKRGVYLWRCSVGSSGVSNRCTSPTDFTASPPNLVELFQPATFDVTTGQFRAPRLSFDWWGDHLAYAALDYSTGTVFYGHCNTSSSQCDTAPAWTKAKVLESGDIRGQADLTIVQGNPLLVVGRDGTRTFVLEPYTKAPNHRAIVPSFSNTGIKATWSSGSLSAADGYRVDTNTTGFEAADVDQSLSPDPSANELAVSVGTGADRYGSVIAYRGQDRSIGQPRFQARSGGRMKYTDGSPATQEDLLTDQQNPKLAANPNAECHVLAWITNSNQLVTSACLKTSDCATFSNWKTPNIVEAATGGKTFDDFAFDAGSGKLHFAYAIRDTIAGNPQTLYYESRTIDTSCNIGGTDPASPYTLASDAGFDGPGRITVMHDDTSPARLFVAFARDKAINHLNAADVDATVMSCDPTTACTTAPTWSTAGFTNILDYFGGPMIRAGTSIAWFSQIRPGDNSSDANYDVRLVSCDRAVNPTCSAVGHWTSPVTAPLVMPSTNTVRRFANASINDGRLFFTDGPTFAWCNAGVGCGKTRDWARGFYSADMLGGTRSEMSLFAGSSSRLQYVGIGNDGTTMAGCETRCWLPDNWFGGYTNRSPETGAAMGIAGVQFGPVGSLSGTSGEATIFYHYREALNPFETRWTIIRNAFFDWLNP